MPVYDNFTDAWSHYSSGYTGVKDQLEDFQVHLGNILGASGWTVLRSETWACFDHLYKALVAHVSPGGMGTDWTGASHYTSMYYSWVEGVAEPVPELTMSAILDALWDAEVHEPLLFIAVVDAMRTSIFDRTMDVPTFARYVRHFSQWP